VKTPDRKNPISSFIMQAIKIYPVIFVLIALVILFSSLYPDKFLSSLNLTTILRQFVTLMLFAVGPSIVVVTGALDLSYVGIWMLGGILVWVLTPIIGISSIFVIPLLGLATGFLIGVINAKVKMPSFILTLSLLVIYSGLTATIAGGIPRTVKGYDFLTADFIPVIPTVFLWTIPIIAVAIYIMKRTRIGIYLYSIGSNEEGAKLAGINVDKYKIIAFTISGLLSGIGSVIIFKNQGGSVPVTLNLNTLVYPLVAIVLGGTLLVGGSGGPHRTILGALTFTILIRGLTISFLEPTMIQLIVGLLLIASIVVGSRGVKGVTVT
jgi:ribose transport system permease protein